MKEPVIMTPEGTIDIPRIDNDDLYERNEARAYEEGFEHCPCCGRAIKNPKYFFNSIWGSSAYPASGPHVEAVKDAWVMGVGPECAKRFPSGYVYEIKKP